MNHDLARAPPHVLEGDLSDLSGTQPQPGQQQQDRIVTLPDRPPAITARQQRADRHLAHPARQRPTPHTGHRWNRPLKRRGDQPDHMQIAQHRAHDDRQQLCRRGAVQQGIRARETRSRRRPSAGPIPNPQAPRAATRTAAPWAHSKPPSSRRPRAQAAGSADSRPAPCPPHPPTQAAHPPQPSCCPSLPPVRSTTRTHEDSTSTTVMPSKSTSTTTREQQERRPSDAHSA